MSWTINAEEVRDPYQEWKDAETQLLRVQHQLERAMLELQKYEEEVRGLQDLEQELSDRYYEAKVRYDRFEGGGEAETPSAAAPYQYSSRAEEEAEGDRLQEEEEKRLEDLQK